METPEVIKGKGYHFLIAWANRAQACDRCDDLIHVGHRVAMLEPLLHVGWRYFCVDCAEKMADSQLQANEAFNTYEKALTA